MTDAEKLPPARRRRPRERGQGQRGKRVNLRLSDAEHATLETAAARHGKRIAAGPHATRDAKKAAAAARKQAATYRAKDAHTKSIADTQTPDQHASEHERRWPKEIYGPYRTFPDLATARDWCAHCHVWIGPGEKPSQ